MSTATASNAFCVRQPLRIMSSLVRACLCALCSSDEEPPVGRHRVPFDERSPSHAHAGEEAQCNRSRYGPIGDLHRWCMTGFLQWIMHMWLNIICLSIDAITASAQRRSGQNEVYWYIIMHVRIEDLGQLYQAWRCRHVLARKPKANTSELRGFVEIVIRRKVVAGLVS